MKDGGRDGFPRKFFGGPEEAEERFPFGGAGEFDEELVGAFLEFDRWGFGAV